MSKKLIIFFAVILLTGCFNSKEEKIYLDDDYYKSSDYIEISKQDLESKDGNYVIFVYNNFCGLQIPCEEIFDDFMKKSNIAFLSIPFTDFKETYLYEEVEYAPSVIVVKNKKVIAYLDANSDDDLAKYQDVEEFEKWISNYIYLTK